MTEAPRLRVVAIVGHPAHLRNFAPTLRALLDRGHDVHIEFDRLKGEARDPGADVAAEVPGASWRLRPRPTDPYQQVRWRLRTATDRLFFESPVFDCAPRIRQRAVDRTPEWMCRIPARPEERRRQWMRRLQRTDRALPLRPDLESLESLRADVLVITPLVALGSSQIDYVRWAARRGIPTAVSVLSWDNLTTKGYMHEPPDSVLVWNDAQLWEAIELHDVPPERIVVTGAASYDHWFDWSPSVTSDEFATRAGLPQTGPHFLYLCSSPFIAPNEMDFVSHWAREVRSHPRLTGVPILVRPHPTASASSLKALRETLSDIPALAVWPPEGENPIGESAKSAYFDSIHHSAAVVGVNTSAMIEAAIVGKVVHTVRALGVASGQTGTIHYAYLEKFAGGMLVASETLVEHAERLATTLAHPELADRERFLRAFVRPRGLEHAAAPYAAAAIESIARPASRSRQRTGLPPPIVGAALAVAAVDSVWAAFRRDRVKPGGRADGSAHAPKEKGVPPVKKTARSDPKRQSRSAKVSPALQIHRAVEEVAAGAGTVIAGPWPGALGSELLVWRSVIRRAVREYDGLAQRLVLISRGGARNWYQDLDCRCLDVGELVARPPGLLRREAMAAETSATLRAYHASMPQDELVALACERLGLDPAPEIFSAEVVLEAMVRSVELRKLPALMPVLDIAPLMGGSEGPSGTIATSWAPPGADASNGPLRELGPGFAKGVTTNVNEMVVDPGSSATGWAKATRQLASAELFVGPYGGLSHLACALGVPAVAFMETPHLASRTPLVELQLHGKGWAGLTLRQAPGAPRKEPSELDGSTVSLA